MAYSQKPNIARAALEAANKFNSIFKKPGSSTGGMSVGSPYSGGQSTERQSAGRPSVGYSVRSTSALSGPQSTASQVGPQSMERQSTGAPANFNYSQVTPPTSAATANTARVAPPVQTKPNIGMAGFTSTDPSIQERIKAMQAQAAPTSPTTQTSTTPPTPASAGAAFGANTVRSAAEKNLEALRAKYLSTLSPSERERELQNQLSEFVGAANLGIAAEEGQGRGKTLDLVRGRQAKLQEQGNLQAQTIADLIGNEQANRIEEGKRYAAEIGFAESALPQESAPIEIGGALVQYNPETGAYEEVYRATESTSPVVLSEGQRLIDPNTGAEIAYSPKDRAPITVSAGQSVYDPNTGQLLFKAADKPEALPSGIQEYMFAVQQGYSGDYNSFKNQANNLNTAVENKNLGFFNRAQAAESDIQAILPKVGNFAQGILPNILRGGDYQQYDQAARAWIAAILRQESGAAIPPDELTNYMRTYFPQTGDSQATIDQKARSRQTAMQSLQVSSGNSGVSGGVGDEIDQWLDFSNDPSMSGNGSAQAIANAIKQVESGGNYNARGASGESGAFQFMPATWKGWAQQYLGNANAPQTPENQDFVALAKINDLLKQGYGPREIALIWNGGQPIVKRGVNQYGVAYDSGAYADKVLNALG